MSGVPPPSFEPMLLISMPQLADPNFERSVVLLCDYGPDGAFGLVVNRPMTQPAHEVIETVPAVSIRDDVYLFTGGPVPSPTAWVLTARPPDGGTAMEVADGVYLTTSPTALRDALQSPPTPEVRVVVGYAGWSPGQLDAELAQASWLIAPIGADLIFATEPERMWDDAIQRLGADPAHLHGSPGVH
ncbi:MAG: YqgE/AlgH family protein [Vicinamibacterales bacterium]